MATVQNSTYFPLPLSNGQILMGKNTFPPVVNTITAGTNTVISNGAGSITVGNTGFASFVVNNVLGTSPVNMTTFNIYLSNATNPIFNTSASAVVGDMYTVVAYGNIVGLNVKVIPGQSFIYNGASGTNLGTSTQGASITLICVNQNPGSQVFAVVNTNGVTFTLT